MRFKTAIMASALAMAITAPVFATEHVIKGVITNWVPLVTYAKQGDTIKFAQMTGHDSETIEGMVPEGAAGWKSKMGEEGFSVKLDKEGAYLYKCNPHITTGMVGAIVVGDGAPANLAALNASAETVKLGKNMVMRTLRKMNEDMKKTGRIP